MNEKYIIKNCPAYNLKHCDCLNTKEIACLYRADCVMKQIVEKCKYYKKHSDCGRDCPSFGMFLSELLNKFDLQEVE